MIVSYDSYNKVNEDIIVLAITSKLKDLDYSIIMESKDLSKGKLKVESEIRVDKIYTLSKNIVKKSLEK